MRLLLLGISIVLFTLQACSTASVRVMPGENGVNEVVSRDIEKEDAEEEAVKAANKYCDERKKEAVFVNAGNKDAKYTGKMDEGTRDAVRKGSKAAMIVGGVTGVAANTTAGAVLGGAGIVGHTMTDGRDYEAKVQFKCR